MPAIRRRPVLWGVAFMAAAALFAFISALLTAPPHYAPVDGASPEAQRLGEATENAAARELSRVRPAATDAAPGSYASEPWDLTFDEDQLNAWLGARLPQWLASRSETMPAGLTSPAVRVQPGRITIAATYATLVGDVVLSQTFEVQAGPPPALTPQGVHAGAVTVPFEMMPTDRWIDHLAKPIRLEDGRAVEILSIEARDATLIVRCRTVKR